MKLVLDTVILTASLVLAAATLLAVALRQPGLGFVSSVGSIFCPALAISAKQANMAAMSAFALCFVATLLSCGACLYAALATPPTSTPQAQTVADEPEVTDMQPARVPAVLSALRTRHGYGLRYASRRALAHLHCPAAMRRIPFRINRPGSGKHAHV